MKKLLAPLTILLGSATYAAAPAVPPSAPTALSPSTSIINQENLPAWGDSLTAGNEDGTGTTYPAVLQSITGYNVTNFGIGGQTSTQIISRQGGVATTLTIGSNTLSSGSNSVTAINGNAVVSMASNSAAVQMLSTAADDTTRTIVGMLCGYSGTLKRTASGGPPSTSETYTFTPTSSVGLPISCAAASAFSVANTSLYPQPAIFWVGRNNYSSGTQVQSDIAGAVSALAGVGNSQYLTLSIINGDYPGEISGQSNYNTIIALNSALSSTYGAKYLDVRSYLVSQYNPGNVVDVLNHMNDVPPLTLRAVDATGTLNGAITSSGCPTLTQTTGALAASYTLLIDSEYIYITTISGNVVSSCTRGYGTGGTAASHSNGASYTGIDPLHLNAAGYTLVANYIKSQKLSILQASLINQAIASASWNSLLGNAPTFGLQSPAFGTFNTLGIVNTPTQNNGLNLFGTRINFLTAGGNSSAFLQPSGNGQYVQIQGSGFIANTDNVPSLGIVSQRFNSLYVGTGVAEFDMLTASSPVYTDANKHLASTAPTQTANTVYSGPTTGAAASPTFRALVGADLPNPSASTLGGVESLAAVSHNFLTSISTSGVPSQAQPAFTDISGAASAGQMPSGVSPVLSGTSGSLGGGALLAGACSNGTTTVTGATTSMTVSVSAAGGTDPGDDFYVRAYVSAADTVTVKVCAAIAGTPTATTYNVRVFQ